MIQKQEGKRAWRALPLVLLLSGILITGGAAFAAFPANSASSIPIQGTGAATPRYPLPEALKNMPEDMKVNHGLYDNRLTAMYEDWLAGGTGLLTGGKGGPQSTSPNKAFAPLYGPDVRMSNGNLLGSGQNEFQIDVNPTNSLNAIGTSNDGGVAGVGIFRTIDGGLTWTSRDASAYGVQASCCDPGVAYGPTGTVYAVILDTSPAASYIIRSTDGGATWQGPATVATPDRENIATDPSNANIVYITYSDLPATNRIKGYKSTDGGVTFGPSFFVGDTAPPSGYEQSSQPRVASNGTLYVGYQQYTNSSVGCAAGVQNVLAKSTDGGATFTYTVLSITQGGACSSAQAGRGIFCVNSGGSSFRSRSHPIIGVSPTNPNHVYMLYSGGDLETAYTCSGSVGFHSDTLFRLSTDGGATFSAASKVNDDAPGKDQYYPWMSVSANGRIWTGWNDRREDPNDFLSRWYQAFSDDEGATWRKIDGSVGNDPVADVQTQPSTFIGDYHGIGAQNGRVLGMWFDSRISGSGDAYTDPQVPPAGGTATPTTTGTPPTATRTNTATITPTRTNSPTVTATPCSSGAIVNGGFETGQFPPWVISGTLPPPVVSNALPHSGTYAALLGTLSGAEPTGNGSISQTITIPTGSSTLSYWWNGQTTDTITFDWQDVYIQTTSGTLLATIQHTCTTTGGYLNQTFDMTPYAGQTVRLVFEVHQDGFGDDTSMYVDDVLLLTACGSPGPSNTPIATNTVGGTVTATPTCSSGQPTWQPGPTFAPGRYAIQAGLGSDGNAYVPGGLDAASTPIPSQMLRYNSTANTWSTVAPPPVTTGENSVGAAGGKVFVAGGFLGGTAITNTLQIYDIASNTWSFGASMPASVEAAAGVVQGGKFYVVGGDDFTVSVRSTYIYDIASNTWTTGPMIPDTNGRTNTYGTASGGLVYVFGGVYIQGATNFPIDTVIIYNPGSNTWTTGASANTGGLGNYGAISPYGPGKLIATDGGNGTFVPATSTHIYNIAANTWTAGPAMTTAREGHAQVTLPDGRVLVYSGLNTAGTVTTTSELLAPQPVCTTPTVTVVTTGTPTSTSTSTSIIPTSTSTAGGTATATSCPPFITQNTSFAITAGNSVSCNAGGVTRDNSYYRGFTLSNYIPSGSSYSVSSVDIGIEQALAGSGGAQPAILNLYTSTTNPPTLASLTLVSTVPVIIPDQSLTIFNIPVPTGATFTSSQILVVELAIPDGTAANNRFFFGSNTATQTGPSYIRSTACGITEITDLAAIGFPNDHLVMKVNGSCGSGTATTTSTTTSTSTSTSTATSTLPVPTVTPPISTATSTVGVTGTSTATSTGTVPVGTLTATSIVTVVSTGTSVGTTTSTSIATSTSTPAVTNTAVGTVTATPTTCVVPFTDVHPEDWFYGYVEYLYCRGVVNGYSTNPPCVTGSPCFLPDNFTTRGQEAKIVVLAFNMPINTTGGPHFTDVLPVGPSSTFYIYVETAKNAGLVDGYLTSPPCTVAPCYLPDSQVTRGQIAKIVVNAAILADPSHWTLLNPSTNTFEDVPVGSTFFRFIETAAAHHILGGYPCGTPPAPACMPGNKPFFFPYNNATRAQISKITFLAVTYPPFR